ncbi:hypothetical protein FNF27_03984 [Cafeteria roenbergensis]|uniref:S1 motif domain-containing protein n=1 Tax=Cafeteria roenbergensis TaxID=33653 RepID=A0A5A8CBT2_CAFRO|nr:hypothetical protein FNF28_07240 [Cafeteria roenbergensis]KAA0155596.1 hypothetical protein FNF29_01513 [Cafeteria roenbergensis]KAA0163854.1 hypothetical protein FNF31_02709 [Cafeteria roenbergensis]KAA0174609.1 hypothetical protein FNF27_03984 [Cafeteria roenbergensis]|eukprot:KAA0155596.1 hypothetical protein FNF29_01513 [Cafeteria roenbergensis]
MAATSAADAAAAATLAGTPTEEDVAAMAENRAAAKSEHIRSLLFGFKCRFYPKEAPDEEELCMVKVRRVAEMGAYVDLLEFEDREGMVLLSELSRRRIRSIKKLIGEGKMEVCMVIRVNEEAGYIDLSKRRVDPEDRIEYESFYNRAVVVQNTMRKIVKDTFDPAAHEDGFNPLRSICERLSWRLYKEYPHAIDGLTAIARDPALLDGYDLTEPEKASLLDQLARKSKAVATKVRTDVQVTCFGYEGVVAIREALGKAHDESTEEFPMSITNVAPPVYAITTVTADVDGGIEALNRATEAARAAVVKYGGNLVVISKPSTATVEEDE